LVSDWSSDVCSSDLPPLYSPSGRLRASWASLSGAYAVSSKAAGSRRSKLGDGSCFNNQRLRTLCPRTEEEPPLERSHSKTPHAQIGRASCRERARTS